MKFIITKINKIIEIVYKFNMCKRLRYFASLFSAIIKIWEENQLKENVLLNADLPIDNARLCRTFSDLEHFSTPNNSKFTLECHSNGEISQNIKNLGFFEKLDCFYLGKT